ncbi:fasciclin domain-containing protein [Thioalkalivibrio sp.]|uniref:fasciclin domain-containing protein n=1 Tax=Thioalkalivibrio sp. TaxID=2093813 RepID=UPI0035691AA0
MKQSYRMALAASLFALVASPAFAYQGMHGSADRQHTAQDMQHHGSKAGYGHGHHYRHGPRVHPRHYRPLPPPRFYGPPHRGMRGMGPYGPMHHGMPAYGHGKAGATRKGHGGGKDGKPEEARADDNSIVAVAQAAGDFDTLLAAAKAGGLADALASNGPFTVFAPVDAAFAELPEAAVNNLMQPENQETLTSLLQHHVVAGRIDAAGVVDAGELESLAGTPLTVEAEGDEVRVGGVRVVQTDIGADNGVIHVVDQVMFPEGFACIATVAQRSGEFETLLAAAEAAGLKDALSVEGPFTIFAPTDAAFEQLPEGTIEELLEPENLEDLQRLLQHHIVAGSLTAEEVLEAGTLETLAGTTLEVSMEDDEPRINGAEIATVDLEASNGVIHVIDTVLMP